MDSTLIYRLSDGLPLYGSMDDPQKPALKDLKNKCKMIISKMNPRESEPMASIESGSESIHYSISNDVIYLVIVSAKFPKKLAFSYLNEIATEFDHIYGSDLVKPNLQPYQFIQFDSFITKTKKIYTDSRAQSNLDKMNNDLADVKQIMNKNIEDLLYRGDSLDKLQDLSSNLKRESAKYKKYAEKINFQMLLKKYAPVALLGFLIVFILYRFIF
ncbi:unnamed protein product [Ambrosiozyma monospora]|uniref:Protein transport protein SEC22 n=1 Tax=Ambrosiozyma monospora TaxID=43982 RepID=A0A9W6Z047_AMBMO|nr:unnamed protein product [Ambrosiozyma monospora]